MQTNVAEWRSVATGAQPGWEFRARIIAKLIRSTDGVFDIGAGDQKLRKFIPPSCIYTPIDCVGDLPGTFVVDFNQEFRLPDAKCDVIVCAGFLEYLNDIGAFFRNLCEQAAGRQIVFTYLLSDESTREAMRVHNNFPTLEALLQAIGLAFSHLDVVAEHNNTIFLSATLSQGGGDAWISRMSINEVLERERAAVKPRGFKRRLLKAIRAMRGKHRR